MMTRAAALFLAILVFVALFYGLRQEPEGSESRAFPGTDIQAEQSATEVPVGESESSPAVRHRSERSHVDVVNSRQVLERYGIDTGSFQDLKNALLDPNSGILVWENAAAALNISDFPGAGEALASAMRIEDDVHSRAVARVMFKIKHEEVLGAMRSIALSDRGEELRAAAIARLAQNRYREVIQTLALSIEESEAIRTQATFGLAYGWKESDELILRTLTEDPSYEVRAAAAIVLSRKVPDVSVVDLIELANQDSLRLETLRNIAFEVSRRVSSDSQEPKSITEIQQELRNKSRTELLADLESTRVQHEAMNRVRNPK